MELDTNSTTNHYRTEVSQKYAGNWERFFIDWRNETLSFNQTLRQQNIKLKQEIDFLVQETKLLKKQREDPLLLKQKRANAKKKAIRESLTLQQFQTILNLVDQSTFKAARIRIAFILLYFTGLRVSNLLILKLSHINELCLKQETVLPIIKNGPDRHFISIGTQGQRFLNQYSKDLLLLKQLKQDNDFLFSTTKNKKLPIARETFDKELNHVLQKASAILGKHLRTHSFRASFITDLLNSGVPIHKVKEIMAHNDINSTATYQRSTVTQKEIRSIISAVNKTRRFSPPNQPISDTCN